MTAALAYLFYQGVGAWGNNAPVYWAWDITNFVWWIGIGHAGTLISAILFLFRQKWRTCDQPLRRSHDDLRGLCARLVSRHSRRPTWFAYYMFPIPNQMGIWPNFKSPLIWDVFAVSTYLTISSIFWYVGLIPDFATLRDRSKNLVRKRTYGVLRPRLARREPSLAELRARLPDPRALSTPLVLSVHSVVSFDFATSVMPGWHTTIFPPYFVAGAVFSGFAMVMTLMLISRAVFELHNIVTMRHLELMNKIMLATGTLVGYAYAMEFFIAWYSGNPYEQYVFIKPPRLGFSTERQLGAVLVGVLRHDLLQRHQCRSSSGSSAARPASRSCSSSRILINIGMWFERFVIIVTSLHRDFLPSSWGILPPDDHRHLHVRRNARLVLHRCSCSSSVGFR